MDQKGSKKAGMEYGLVFTRNGPELIGGNGQKWTITKMGRVEDNFKFIRPPYFFSYVIKQ